MRLLILREISLNLLRDERRDHDPHGMSGGNATRKRVEVKPAAGRRSRHLGARNHPREAIRQDGVSLPIT